MLTMNYTFVGSVDFQKDDHLFYACQASFKIMVKIYVLRLFMNIIFPFF